jgi:hypothetical protein
MKNIFLSAGVLLALATLISCEKNLQTNRNDAQMMMNGANGKAIATKVIWAKTITLSGENEVPNAVMTSAKGIATLQLTDDMRLYSKVQVSSLEEGDGILFGHIHRGAAGSNGPVLLTLLHGPEDVGMQMEMQLTEAQYNALVNDALYVNVHSAKYPGGLLRGQIR